MSIGQALRQFVESMPEQEQKEYKDKIICNAIKKVSNIVNRDILLDIHVLIDKLFEESDDDNNYSDQLNNLLREAASKIDDLAIYIVYSENKAATSIYRLEEQLKTKHAYIEYLHKRLSDSDAGYVKE